MLVLSACTISCNKILVTKTLPLVKRQELRYLKAIECRNRIHVGMHSGVTPNWD